MTATEPSRPGRYGRVLIVLGIAVLAGIVAFGSASPRPPDSTRSAPGSVSAPPAAGPTATPDAAAPDTTAGPPSPAGDFVMPPTAGARTTTEVDPATSVIDALPATADPAALLSGDAPPSASDVGALVAGFPAAVPILDDSAIESSSVDSNGGTLQATVVARTSLSPDEVIARYETVFAALGLPGSTVQSAAGDRAVAFAGAGSSVTLTAGSGATGTRYSLFAVIALAR